MAARSAALKAEGNAMHAVEKALDGADKLPSGARRRVLDYAAELVETRRDPGHVTAEETALLADAVGHDHHEEKPK